jgi:hypothetical protein
LLFTFLYCFVQEISGAIDLESDADSYGSDDIAVVETMRFVKDLIVTPPMTCGKDEIESDVAVTLKGICQSV